MNKKILRILGGVSIPFMYLVFFLAIKYISYINFSWDLLFFATLGFAFVSLHFFLDIKKMYNWAFDHRYLIGIVIFLIFVIGGYHGSSINMWDRYIDPDVNVSNTEPILGVARGIRSDEWLVTSPHNLSQTIDRVNFSKINTLMNGKENLVSFYPRLIVKDLGILLHPEQIGFLILPRENAFSFNWYFPYFLAFFVTIELLMLITKKNKLYSTLGAFLLVLSSSNLWWNSCGYILYGGLALLIINKFINTKSIRLRILLSILLGWVAGCYISIMYPAWLIPYAYLFGLIFIWLLIENKKKIKWSDLLYLIITGLTFGGLFIPLYLNSASVYEIVSNTVYPGSRVWYGGGIKANLLFTYIVDMFFPFASEVSNPCEYSQHLSLFPIPLIMGYYYLFRNKKQKKKMDWFLLLLTVYGTFLTALCLFKLPKFIATITLLSMSTSYRAQLVVGYTSIFLLVYIMSKYEVKDRVKKFNKDKKIQLLVAILSTALITYLGTACINNVFEGAINKLFIVVAILLFIPVVYFTIRNKKQTNFILAIMLIGINAISILLIQPLDRGLEILYEKPFAKEIQKIVNDEPDALFLNVNEFIAIQNYVLVNGGKSINSTNYIPNLDLYHKLDENNEYNDVYNRYSHVAVKLSDEPTKFELIQEDLMLISLNYEDICLTGANYLVSDKKLDENEIYYTNVYGKYDSYIYKTTCSN